MQLRASIVTYFLRSSIGDQVIETLFATGREHTVSHEKKIVARFKAESFNWENDDRSSSTRKSDSNVERIDEKIGRVKQSGNLMPDSRNKILNLEKKKGEKTYL